MKYFSLVLSLFFITSIYATCIDGNGQIETKRLELDTFEKISLSTMSKVFLYQGPQQKIDIIAEGNLIEYISLKVNDKKWSIHFKECVSPSKPVEIHITIPIISGIVLNGTNDLIASGLIQSDDMEVEVNGSGQLELNLNVKNLETEINGSAHIRYSGSVTSHKVEINGAAEIVAYDLISEQTKVTIRGAGDVQVNAQSSLKIKIFGTGDIKYKGNPGVLDIRKYGAGDVNKVPD